MEKVQILCIPHAGGMASTYSCFRNFSEHRLTFDVIELSGRGYRSSSPLYDSFEQAIRDIAYIIGNRVGSGRFALFGHSMGSWLAYGVYTQLETMGYPLPEHLFLSSNIPPCFAGTQNPIHNLPDNDFMERIIEFGGTPRAILQYKELREMIIPVLKSDFRILENWRQSDSPRRVKCGITVLYGLHDHTLLGRGEDLHKWWEYTYENCDFYPFSGDHFYFLNNVPSIVDLMLKCL